MFFLIFTINVCNEFCYVQSNIKALAAESESCDTGTTPPERCIFGFMMSISGFLGVVTIYVRYKQVETLNQGDGHSINKLNRTSLVLGLISCLGLCIVANFQVMIHLHGASE
ncbi:hypothetical protein scyTo_0015011 [Scyliorhinus torazame]|uniref:CWH43-like N-terminal domain-containing protein n=1 Tax=Scyliorhinus torazame TaxID=75743 RepID=A0A401P0C9_SCYTO|nr:hypothetical protein [Scyliorhinus torazame]